MKSIFVASMLLLSGIGHAQIQSYIVDTIPYQWEDFDNYDAASELIALVGEDEVYPLVIPFTFQYFDNNYAEIFASVNGNASFGQSYQGLDFNRENLCEPVTTFYNPAGEQNSANPDNFIGVYWDDLFIDPTCDGIATTTPKMVYRTIGTAPNREFIICWENLNNSRLEPCAEIPINQFVSAQVRLQETTNIVEVYVRNNTLAAYNGTIAVENIDGTYAAYAACGTNGQSHELKGYRFTPSTEEPPIDTTGTEVGYCEASGGDCNVVDEVEPIVEVILGGDNGGFTNSSGCDGYGNYSDSHFAYMTPGLNYSISVDGNATGYIFGTAEVYVDWNEDFDFSDPDELVAIGTNWNGGLPFTSEIVVPLTVTNGVKRMRIRTGLAGPLAPCGTINNGEVEDYSIVIGNPPSCMSLDIPANGATDRCQSTLLQWSGDSTNADGYYVFLAETGNPLVRVDSIGDTSIQEYLATGLNLNTSYDWRVIPFNADGSALGCDTMRFTTGANEDPVVQIIVNGVDHRTPTVEVCNTATLSGVDSLGTFASGINIATWSVDTAFLDANNVLDVNFTADSIGKYFFYTLTIEDDNGCKASNSVSLHTNESNAGVIVPAADYVCDGDSIMLYVDGNSDPVVDWEFAQIGGPFISSGLSGDTIFAGDLLQDLTYRAIVQSSIGCTDTTGEIVILYEPKPGSPSIAQSNDTLFASPIGETIHWFMVGTPDSLVATGDFYVPAIMAADYYAVIENGLGCKSDPSNVLVFDWEVGVSSLDNQFKFNIYPNPTSNIIHIESNSVNEIEVKMMDVAGRNINNWILNGSNKYTLQLEQPRGIYVIAISKSDVIIAKEQVIIK